MRQDHRISVGHEAAAVAPGARADQLGDAVILHARGEHLRRGIAGRIGQHIDRTRPGAPVFLELRRPGDQPFALRIVERVGGKTVARAAGRTRIDGAVATAMAVARAAAGAGGSVYDAPDFDPAMMVL